MFKYSAINSYSIKNLHRNQIYFNHPYNFNDPFDTFHPTLIKNVSEEKLINLFGKFTGNIEDKDLLIKILNEKASKIEFYNFCIKYIGLFNPIKNENQDQVLELQKKFVKKLDQILEEDYPEFYKKTKSIINVFKDSVQQAIINSVQTMRNDIFKNIGVCCFSKNNKSLLMWSHYADSHRGFCLEFDPNQEPFSKAKKVTYQSNIPEVDSDLLFSEEEDNEAIDKFLSFKSKDWDHEKEWRIFHKESNKSYQYPRNSLKAIYFGLRTDQTDIEIICSVVKTHNPDVKFFRMKRVENQFGIEPENISYHTPVEIQSILISTISLKFGKNAFSGEQLFRILNLEMKKDQFQIYMEDMAKRNILKFDNSKYKLNI